MRSLDTIVFPTDFSNCSDRAFDYAVLLAEKHGAELHLLHATVLLADDPAHPSKRFPEEAALLARLEEVTRSKLGELVEHELVSTLKVREATRRGYAAGEVILDYAREQHADAIVMGTHGRRGPSRWFLGSVAEDVLRRAVCPVLVVREEDEKRELQPFGTILVPVDFSDHSRSAVESAAAIAHDYKAGLALLHVIDLPAVPSLYGQPLVADTAEIGARATEGLETLAGSLGLHADEVELAVDTGSPGAAIVDYAAVRECGLIVMPAHSRRRAGLLGSTTEQVIRRTTCPVLALPSQPAESSEAG